MPISSSSGPDRSRACLVSIAAHSGVGSSAATSPNRSGSAGTPRPLGSPISLTGSKPANPATPPVREMQTPTSGFFPVPNELLAAGHAVALLTYARLASTPAIWTPRGDLSPYEVRVSRAQLVTMTGATPNQVRGALAWLIRRGFLERLDTGRRTTAVYRITKHEAGASDATPTTSASAPDSEPPSLPENHQASHQAEATPNPLPGNGLRESPNGPFTKLTTNVLKTSEDTGNPKTLTVRASSNHRRDRHVPGHRWT